MAAVVARFSSQWFLWLCQINADQHASKTAAWWERTLSNTVAILNRQIAKFIIEFRLKWENKLEKRQSRATLKDDEHGHDNAKYRLMTDKRLNSKQNSLEVLIYRVWSYLWGQFLIRRISHGHIRTMAKRNVSQRSRNEKLRKNYHSRRTSETLPFSKTWHILLRIVFLDIYWNKSKTSRLSKPSSLS